MKLLSRFAVLLPLLLLSAGCARQPFATGPSDHEANAAEDGAKLPFDQPPDKSGISPSSSLVPAARNVPAGTPLTIRLKSPISTATANPGESFQAVLEEPVVMQGRSIVDVGTAVTGEVVALKRSARPHAPAYLHLRLTSVVVDGKPIPIESSSIVAKAGLQQGRTGVHADTQGGTGLPSGTEDVSGASRKVGFGVEQRLTFRLTAPASLPR